MMNILFLRAGSFSNLNHYLYQSMSRSHNIVHNVDAGKVLRRRCLQFSPLRNFIHTLIHSGKFWKQSYSKNSYAFSSMTRYCNAFIRSRTDYDIVFQTQCKFSITENPYSRPYYIYTDLTQRMTDRLWDKWALKSAPEETEKWYRMETEAFRRADKIFTFNPLVKSSFIEDYHIPEERIVVVGSGINSEKLSGIHSDTKYDSERIMFLLCTEFDRQGGAAVLEGYQILRQQIPGIKLIIGGRRLENIPEHVEHYSNLTRDVVEQLFQRASIFLMPGSLGGLQSVLEAMSKKCVCIVGDSNVLLTDVIQDDHTGIIVQTNNSRQLAEKVIELYRNEALMKKIANQAYHFVMKNYTWDHVVQRMTSHFKVN
jgi:glycosyltransferase involved in cell wall biosynthesis